jgi:hypothetical protein
MGGDAGPAELRGIPFGEAVFFAFDPFDAGFAQERSDLML